MRYVMIGMGGALGAIARYQVSAMIHARVPIGFPWGTFIVNVSGCLAMGFVMTLLTDRLVLNPEWRYLVPIGFLGAYTTFSTFAYEAFAANLEGAWPVAAAYVASSVAVGYLALWAGVVLGRSV